MSKELVDRIKSKNWHSDWSGSISLIDICMAPGIYTSGFRKLFGVGFNDILVTFKNGIAWGKFPEDEYDKLGRIIASKMSDHKFANDFVSEFKKITDEIFIKINVDSDVFLNNLTSMRQLYADYGAHSEAAKIGFNFLTDDNLDIKILLETARKYSEKFYHDNARVYEKLAANISEKVGIEKNLILMLTNDELLNYLGAGTLPNKEILESRYFNSGVFWNNEKLFFLNGNEINELEYFWNMQFEGNVLKGVSAFPGFVKGKCRVILNYQESLKKDEILVTGMTTPDFVPLMKNAGAIITDGGGMLCHAAIVAREMKKPCIIGTKIATKVLNDGDLVEVDADKGIVRIIKN